MLRHPVFTIALLGVVVAGPALAQTPPDRYPPPCDSTQVSRSDVDRAHAVFLSGKEFLDESNYDKAISYFVDAYSIDCSVHAILPIIATAYERKGDKAEAVRALEEYLKRAPKAPDHEIVERRIHNLKDQLAHEQPTPAASAAPSSSVSVAAEPPPTAPAPSSAGVGPAAPLVAAPPPAPPSTESHAIHHGVAPWVTVGIGGAAVVAGIVLLSVGSSDISDALSTCNGVRKCSNASAVSQGNDGRSLEQWGVVTGAIGVGVAAAGLIWHFVEKPTEAPTSGAMHPVVAPGYAGVAGTF